MDHDLVRRLGVASGLGLLSMAAFASGPEDAAAPPAPSGWQRTAADGHLLYRSQDAAAAAELRLYPPQADPGALADWLRARLARPVPGVGPVAFGAPRPHGGQALAALGRVGQGANARVVMGMACTDGGGAKRYAELIVPADPATVQRQAEAGARLAASACAAPAPVAQAAPVAQTPQTAQPAPPPRPAQALSAGQIEGVLYAWDQVYTAYGLQMQEWTYLLLKDGRVRRGLPRLPPDLFDPEADRRAEPALWGQWRRAGGRVQVRFDGGFITPPGQLWRRPGAPGQRLQGRYRAASSVSIGSVSAWASWGLTLQADGRFRRWSTRGMGGSTGQGSNAVTTMAIGDDKGSVSSATGAHVGGGARRDTGVTDDDLEGSYQIDGWSLTLRYRSGAVQRGFFYVAEDGDSLWFEGAELMRDKADRAAPRR